MKLGDKIRYLRSVEGTLYGLGRSMTQTEIVRAIKKQLGKTISQSYLSQIENGTRPHLTNTTRMLLAKFFRVHPGYLVDDPEGFHNELMTDILAADESLDLWLVDGSERFRRDPGVSHALLKLAQHRETRKCLALMNVILDTPDLLNRLYEVLSPDLPRKTGSDLPAPSRRRRSSQEMKQ